MIQIPVSLGELVDKLTILEIKKLKVKDPKKLINITNEAFLLQEILTDQHIDVSFFQEELQKINSRLWDIEDQLRVKELHKEFDIQFISLARLVYITNDLRFEIKNKINDLTQSSIREEKCYINYKDS